MPILAAFNPTARALSNQSSKIGFIAFMRDRVAGNDPARPRRQQIVIGVIGEDGVRA